MYTPLNIKTDNYLQYSMIKISDLIKYAKELNITSLSITDNNMYGVMDFYKACINNNIKPIIGLEIKLNDLKLILYAKNYNGYKNLIKLSTIQSERNINIQDIEKHNYNLVCIIPYESNNLYESLKSIYEDIFLSYKNLLERNNKDNNAIYMNEILYLKSENYSYMRYLEAIRDGVTVNFIENDYKDNYLKTESEIPKEDLYNNKKITDMCNIEIPFNLNLMPKFEVEDQLDSYSYLKKLCIEGLKKHFGNTVNSVYQKRLKYELDTIHSMEFCDYFLIVQDYVNYAKNNNIIVGTGRGSAVGSLVSYCLNITDVDPIKYDLLFERFLNPERISMPDIDIDFEHEKRDQVINYCMQKYGEKRVAPIIAFGTLGAKQAIRDVSRSMDLDLKEVDTVCKLIDSRETLVNNYKKNIKLREYLERKKHLFYMYKKAIHFEGLKRHTTIHAAGIVMSNEDLDSVIPLDKSHENFYTTSYDMTYLEQIGLLKMDFLAIKYLTTIHNIIDSINENEHTNISFDNIPLNDTKAINIFTKADTIGVFQFESSGMINFLKQMQPSSLNEIFAAIALFRPGPMKNIPSYIKRKNGQEKIDYIHPDLEKVLKSTYGIMIYQEQIMMIANIMADYSLGEADVLRKAMSKKNKDLLLKEKEKFTKRSINKGYDKKIVDKIYGLMLKFAEYGFNKSHSVGYSIVAYKMAYLKAYYPEYFIVNLLSMEQGNATKTKQYIYEAKKYNINILSCDINKSKINYSIENHNIRYPLTNIKGINSNCAKEICLEREKGNFVDIYDFIKRCYGKVINRKVIESLILVGAFDGLGFNRKTLFDNLDAIINYGELIKDLDSNYVLKPDIEKVNDYTNKEIMNLEDEYLGLYLTNHPISIIRNKYSDVTMLEDIPMYFNKIIKVVVYVDRIKEINTQKNEKMAFVTVSDEVMSTTIVFFPRVYKEYNIEKEHILLIEGRVEKRYDEYQVIANKVVDTALHGSNEI